MERFRKVLYEAVRQGPSRYCSTCNSGSQCWKGIKSRLPRKQHIIVYFICFINLFAQSFSSTMLFPFLPFMVKFLVPDVGETALGRYVGVVGGALYLGRTFGSYMWGIIADKKGRKPVIVMSGILMSIGVIIFGFSVNLAMAIVARFLTGFFGGTLTSVKAMVSEISDDRFQAFGLSVIGAAWSLGYIIGPAVSGAIADPIGQYNLTISNPFFHGFLTKFPYSLPCMVNTLLFAIGVIPAIFCLPETLGMKRNRRRSELGQLELKLLSRNRRQEMDGEAQRIEADQLEESSKGDRARLLVDENEEVGEMDTSLTADIITENVVISNPMESMNNESTISPDRVNSKLNTNTADVASVSTTAEVSRIRLDGEAEDLELNSTEEIRQPRLYSLWISVKNWARHFVKDVALFLCNRGTLVPLVLYMVYSFGMIGYYEIFSLWASTQPYYGGVGFSLQQISIVLAMASFFQFPVNMFSFAILERYLKSIKVFYLGCTILIFTVPMLPHLHYLVNVHPSAVLWVLLVMLAFIITSCGFLLFSTTFLFINNSVTFDKLGAINGLAMTLTSITRSVSPILFGFVFSLSLSETTLKIGFPLNYNLVFVCFSLTFVFCIFLVASLPASINKQKVIEDE